jgi:four helix bundle protein
VQNNIAEGNARRGRADRHRLFNVALSSLAEVDSMLATIPVLYSVDQSVLDSVEVLRRQITAGVLAMIKRGRK